MIRNILNYLRNSLLVSVSRENKTEFEIGINRINITRAKYTIATFIIIEIIMITVSYFIKKGNFFDRPDIYYTAMYFLMLIFMIICLIIIIKLGKDIAKYLNNIKLFGVIFASFILCWCAFISLMDQWSSGQVIVYTVAILAIAVTPIYNPIILLIIYLSNHILFIILLTYFQKSDDLFFSNFVNSTTFILISWAISCMRYVKHLQDFDNKKLLHEKSKELIRLNKELEETNRKLDLLSQTDTLTGTFNRFGFDKKVNEEWTKCKLNSEYLAIIIIDIDFFKKVNDNYGHQAGDNCLKQVANILSASLRNPSDFLARYGGDEFVILLNGMDETGVLEFASQLVKKVENSAIPNMFSSISKYLSISSGACSIIPTDSLSIDKFIQSADNALYEAKKCRNKIVVSKVI